MSGELPAACFSVRPFAPFLSSRRLVLMYHQLKRPERASRLRGLCVAPALFNRQLREFRRMEVHSASIASEPAAPARPEVVLTFDDGFSNVLRNGLPLLRQHGFRAINYLVADRLGKTNDWDAVHHEPPEPLMDEAQVRDWLAGGMEIGAHTLTHPHLSRLTLTDAKREIMDSKRKLEDRFGRAIEHFCYPYGDFSPAVRDTVIGAGFLTACSTAHGLNASDADCFALRRVIATHRRPGALAWCPLLPGSWL